MLQRLGESLTVYQPQRSCALDETRFSASLLHADVPWAWLSSNSRCKIHGDTGEMIMEVAQGFAEIRLVPTISGRGLAAVQRGTAADLLVVAARGGVARG